MKLVEDVRPDHREGALSEVKDPRASVDDHQALSEQGVGRCDSEAEDGELKDFFHAIGAPLR